jgi:hypothetical protein
MGMSNDKCKPLLSECPEIPTGYRWAAFEGEPAVRDSEGYCAWITEEEDGWAVTFYSQGKRTFMQVEKVQTSQEALSVLASRLWLGINNE